MKEILIIALQISICSGLLYGYYHIWLRDKRFHQYNRFYLLAATLFSLVLPFLNIPLYFTEAEQSGSLTYKLLSVATTENVEVIARRSSPSFTHWQFSWSAISIGIYWLLFAFLALRLLIALVKIFLISRRYSGKPFGDLLFFNTGEPQTPYVFFNWLFWNKELDLETEKGQKIFRHEYFHIRQRHSWDLFFMELTCIIAWFNPFFHLIKKELTTIHEFLADEYALGYSDKYEYAELLILEAIRSRQRMTQPFFSNHLKRRIAMITLQSTPKRRYFRKLLVLPLAAILFGLLAFKVQRNAVAQHTQYHGTKTFTVVIDAGHGVEAGGGHNGARYDGLFEDELMLALSKKIAALNQNDMIKIVQTRSANAIVDLHERTKIANENKADLFLSLHVGMSTSEEQANTSGWKIYISRKNQTYTAENKLLSTILFNELSTLTAVNNQIMQQQTGIWVLDQSQCPSALIECGFLDKEEDRMFLNNSANQEKIASKILQGIEAYAEQQSNPDFAERLFKITHPRAFDLQIIQQNDGSLAATLDGSPVNKVQLYTAESGAEGILFIYKDSLTVTFNKEMVQRMKSQPKFEQLLSQYEPGDIVPPPARITMPVLNVNDSTPETAAHFPGGQAGWRNYLSQNLNANIPVDSGAPTGQYTVWTQFEILENGRLKDIKALTSNGYGMEREVLRILTKGPDWKPATKDGKPVATVHKQPVTFVIVGDDDSSVQNLPEVTGVAYETDAKEHNPSIKVDYYERHPNATIELGSIEWRRYLERYMKLEVPVSEWQKGEYHLAIYFKLDAKGRPKDVTVMTDKESQTSRHLEELIKNGPRLTTKSDLSKAVTYRQPFAIIISG